MSSLSQAVAEDKPTHFYLGQRVTYQNESCEVWNVNDDGTICLFRSQNKPHFIKTKPQEIKI